MVEHGHVVIASGVLVLVVSKHVEFLLDLLLPLKHGNLFVSVNEVVKVCRSVGSRLWGLRSTELLSSLCGRVLFFVVRFLRHQLPLRLLFLIKHLIMVHELKVFEIKSLGECYSFLSVLHDSR